jgi:Pentapeptide repeats (8 copies)
MRQLQTLTSTGMISIDLEGADLGSAQLQGAGPQEARLQGASLEGAELQGASLEGADLSGADLGSAQLQAADLGGARLFGASLFFASLEGTSFYFTQLEGADFRQSKRAGTNMNSAHVWRTSFESASVGAVFGRFWNEGADCLSDEEAFSKDGFAYLEAHIMKVVPEGKARENALKRIKKLNPDILGPEASVCEMFGNPREDSAAYENALMDELKKLVCSGHEDALYIVRGLTRTPWESRIKDARAQAPNLVNAILSKDCPVSAALTEQDKAALKEVATDPSFPNSMRDF